MAEKRVDPELCVRLAREHGTPFYLYDAAVIRAQLSKLRAFDVIRFAQKALSNIHVLRLLKAEGALIDAVSGGELERALRAGYRGAGEPAGVVFTADVIDEATLDRVIALDVPVNAGSADMLEQVGKRKSGHRVWLEIEPGRFLVAESGVLVSQVLAAKRMDGTRFLLLDAGFNDLMRPAMYGSYHGISVVSGRGEPATGATEPTVVAGPLCESGDAFTQEEGGVVVTRDLPPAAVGDFVVLHDAGDYAASQASNYNSRPHLPELLLDGGHIREIRRRQTIDELLDLEDL